MADVLKIIILIVFALVSVTGTTLNCLTMFVLTRNKTLIEKLASVRWLMFGESFSGLIVCAIGVPLLFANNIVGYNPPFTTSAVLCHFVEFLAYGFAYVAMWYQATIALTRLTAVVAPNVYRQYVRKKLATIALCAWPWFIGFIEYAVGAAAHAFRIDAVAGSGTCAAIDYDKSPEAPRRYARYALWDTILHYWIPASLGLVSYGIIFSRKWLRRNKIWATGAATVTATTHPLGTAGAKIIPLQRRTIHASSHGPKDAAVATTTPVSAIMTAVVSGKQKRVDERYKKIKLLAIAYLVNVCLIFPNTGFCWGMNYFQYLSQNAPGLVTLFYGLYFLAFPIVPLLYAIVSPDFRGAFRQVLRCSK